MGRPWDLAAARDAAHAAWIADACNDALYEASNEAFASWWKASCEASALERDDQSSITTTKRP